jgi:hypothetical protein
MKPDNKKFLKFVLLCFLTAWLAYSFYFLFTVVNGSSGDWYMGGIIMHLPFWFFAMLVGGLIVKILIPKKVTFLLEVLLMALLLLPVIYKPATGAFDYLVFPFNAVNYFLCLALLKKLRLRIIKS